MGMSRGRDSTCTDAEAPVGAALRGSSVHTEPWRWPLAVTTVTARFSSPVRQLLAGLPLSLHTWVSLGTRGKQPGCASDAHLFWVSSSLTTVLRVLHPIIIKIAVQTGQRACKACYQSSESAGMLQKPGLGSWSRSERRLSTSGFYTSHSINRDTDFFFFSGKNIFADPWAKGYLGGITNMSS